MRTYKHWTPRYIFNRSKEILYQKLNPNLPWLTPVATKSLATLLLPTDVGVEFGSGRSTIWFAGRIAKLTSVEHHEQWFGMVQKRLAATGRKNVDYVLAKGGENVTAEEYLSKIKVFPDASVDFVLVDGMFRDICAVEALRIVKPGGVVAVDNCNWYLPNESKAPASLPQNTEPPTAEWRQFWATVLPWRRIWTSSGVTDTAIFFKPLVS